MGRREIPVAVVLKHLHVTPYSTTSSNLCQAIIQCHTCLLLTILHTQAANAYVKSHAHEWSVLVSSKIFKGCSSGLFLTGLESLSVKLDTKPICDVTYGLKVGGVVGYTVGYLIRNMCM